MGCPSEVVIGDNLVFSICTHDPDTGVLTNADGNPAYRIYEDDTALAIANGTMAPLDAGSTTGFYVKKIACTAPTYTAGKSYSVYIEATVDGDKGGICYGFKAVAVALSAADIKTAMEAAGSNLALIKAKTDSLTFGTALRVDAQVKGTDDIDFTDKQKSTLRAVDSEAPLADISMTQSIAPGSHAIGTVTGASVKVFE